MRSVGLAWLVVVAGCLSPKVVDPEEMPGSTGVIEDPTTGEPQTTTGVETTTGPDDTGIATTVDPSGSPDDCLSVEQCVALAPEGWEGPVAFIERGTIDTLPACQEDYDERVLQTYDQLDGSPMPCLGCQCDAGTNVECTLPEIRFYNSSSCDQFGSAALSEYTLLPDGECTEFPASAGLYGAEADEVVPVEGTGSCAPVNVTPELPEPVWGTIRRACAPSVEPAGCGTGRVCAPTPTAPFDESLCIWAEGDQACPDGEYTEKSVYYQGVDDQRSCSACECGPTTGGDCDAEILLSHQTTCADDYVHVPNYENNCTFLNGDPPDSGMLIINAVEDVVCEPAGGDVSGEATPNQPVTFCCTGG